MDFDATRTIPNSAQYQRQHRWIKRQLGKAKECSNDNTHESTRYDWSNISGDYHSDLSDWRELCRSCHLKYDGISEAGLRRMSEANKINSLGNTSACKPVMMIAKDGTETRFKSSKAASDATGIKRTNIANVINGWTKTAGGYQWQRIGG